MLLISIIDLVLLDFSQILTRDAKIAQIELGAQFDRVTIYVKLTLSTPVYFGIPELMKIIMVILAYMIK